MPRSSYTRILLKRLLIWGGPLIIMFLMIIVGFGYWVFTSSSGARWVLVTAARLADGEVKGVNGTFLNGLRINSLKIDMDDMSVDAQEFYLKVNWQQLIDRHIHIPEISLKSLNLNLNDTKVDDTEESTDPLKTLQNLEIPELPVTAQIDKIGLEFLKISINEQPLDFNVHQLELGFNLTKNNADVSVKNINANYIITSANNNEGNIKTDESLNIVASSNNNLYKTDIINTRLNGKIALQKLQAPWDTLINLTVISQSPNSDFLCANSYLDTLPESKESVCQVAGFLNAKGSLKNAEIETMLHGQGMKLFSSASLKPLDGFPLRDAKLELGLADNSGLLMQLNWDEQQNGHNINASINANDLNISALLGDTIPSFILNTNSKLNVNLNQDFDPIRLDLDADIKPNTIWNDQDLNGKIIADANIKKQVIQQLKIDLNLGDNKIKANGNLGSNDSALNLNINAPALKQLWPEIAGGIGLEALIKGSIDNHSLQLETEYTPADFAANKIGLDKAHAQISMSGSLLQENQWQGQISNLKLSHAGLGLNSQSSIPLKINPESQEDIWKVGNSDIELFLREKPILNLHHDVSGGNKDGHLHTSGKIAQIEITQELLDNLEELLDLVKPKDANAKIKNRGGIKMLNVRHHDQTDLSIGLDWNVKLANALSGKISLRHLGGDVMIPGDEPMPLGLNQLDLDVDIKPGEANTSSIHALFKSNTKNMGGTQITASTVIHKTENGLIINPSDPIKANIKANIEDLAWLSIFAGDDLQFSGHLDANIDVNANINGEWSANGDISGNELRIIRLDDGVRLINGKLNASINNTSFNLQELYFPASLRVIPKHQRLATWLQESKESKNGSLKINGKFDLKTFIGDIAVNIDKFPVVQRSDRFAMLSGKLDINASLDHLDIGGEITADAGWVNIDMLSGIDGVDSDVVVTYDDEPIVEVDNPMNISMSVVVRLGDRLYLTGFGLNSGLTGGMRISLLDNKLSGLGVIRTRGGSIQAYGQKLQIRRGTITFQGEITNPLLDIEALRTGLAVEAGVKVAGTAKKPRIDLISYPEVSDVEKLSWLLFGHGPDEAGGDMALLVSVGTSLLGDGEPFYRKFGIDEVALKAGEVGTVGSILPVESVVSGLARDTSELENQFIAISKQISWGFTVGLQQAMSDTGTVATVSYRLMRGLTAELSLGTNNGLALIYRWFSRPKPAN